MNKLITIGLATTLLGLSQSSLAKDIQDPVAFIKQMPYHQVVKELALSRCRHRSPIRIKRSLLMQPERRMR